MVANEMVLHLVEIAGTDSLKCKTEEECRSRFADCLPCEAAHALDFACEYLRLSMPELKKRKDYQAFMAERAQKKGASD